MKKITNKSPLWVAMALVLVFAVSCVNDKTFEGIWKKTEQVSGRTIFLKFNRNNTGSILRDNEHNVRAYITFWKANFSKKTLKMSYSKAEVYEIKADYKFSKDFKKLELSNVEVSGGDPSMYATVKAHLQGDHDKQ